MKSKILLIEGRPEVVEWWNVHDFRGRFNMVMPADEHMRPAVADPAQLEIIAIADDCIICDRCNADLTIFPVPVFSGSALCQECFKRLVS